ncbi:hypothetical protein [Microcoleus sp. herbarium14]|uniref:hypothetical protein n=1 Tax=Microcoleus sp. herbarium14 TaxID=3055439 RepID=UPI002FD0654A
MGVADSLKVRSRHPQFFRLWLRVPTASKSTYVSGVHRIQEHLSLLFERIFCTNLVLNPQILRSLHSQRLRTPDQ